MSKDENKLKKKNRIKNVIIIILMIVILILLLRSCIKHDNPLINLVSQQLENSDYKTNANDVETGRIDVPIIEDVTVSEDFPYITLYNPSTNADKYYLQYELYLTEGGELLYQSNMVEPDKKFSADIIAPLKTVLGDSYKSGVVYDITVKVRVYRVNDLVEVNGITNDIKINVKN